MTPKEKAQELVDKFYTFGINNISCPSYSLYECWQLALIAVDEIIASNPIAFDEDDNCIAKDWWQEVKKEIEKL
jgi:hypothetical protein